MVSEDYTHRKTAYPATMKIRDTPKIMIHDNAYYQTFYHTNSMKSTFEFPYGSNILRFTELKKAEDSLLNQFSFIPHTKTLFQFSRM